MPRGIYIPWIGDQYSMDRGKNTMDRGCIYHGNGGQNTMGRRIKIPSVGGRYTMGRGSI